MRMILSLLWMIGVAMAAQPYNLLLIVSDDIGQDQSWINTDQAATIAPQPRLETLASQGTLMTGCRTMPVCSPSRMSLLTGRSQKRTGVYVNSLTTFPESEYTIADDLNSRGYATAMFGKWGLGTASGNDEPRTRGGFDYFAGLLNLTPSSYWSYTKYINNVSTPVSNKYLTSDTTDDAIAWIDAQSDPWAAVVCYNAAHAIGLSTTFSIPPAELLSSAPPSSAVGVDAYRATIEAMDTEIGRLLDSIDTSNTIIVYVSDNGGEYPQAPNINGEKGSEYDDAHKVPVIFKGPGITAGAVKSYTCNFTDLYPTIIKLLGNYTPASPNTLDGRDFSGIFNGEVVPIRYSFVAVSATGPFCATDGSYRLIDYQDATPDLFFDLRTDPHELADLGTSGLTGPALKAYRNLRYALTTYTAKAGEQAVVEVNYAQPSVVSGGIRVVSGGLAVNKPAVGSATITAPLKSGATDYTLWIRNNPFGAWEDSGLTESVGATVSFTDPSPTGRKEYRITNNAPEP